MKNAKKVLYYALKTFEGLLFTFVTIIALASVVMLFQYKVLNRPVPTVFGFSQVSILSGAGSRYRRPRDLQDAGRISCGRRGTV